MPEVAVRTKVYPRGRRIVYEKKALVEFCPWIRTESLETHVLISDLAHSLGVPFGPAEAAAGQLRRLERWASMERIVDQYAADGTLLASYARKVAPDAIWRLSLGKASQPSLEYGLLVFRGPYTLNHFQIVGPGTFATCHSRRFLLDEPASDYSRGVTLPVKAGVQLSLFLMNRGAGPNQVRVLSQRCGTRVARAVTVTLPRLGSKLLCLSRTFPSAAEAEGSLLYHVEGRAPFDFYTLMENSRAPEETFSIQHIK